jgi:uncharacterized protein with von Willebrand factor type A (vWA) domain
MKAPMLGFISVARNAGIAVSTAETIDAMNALELIGYDDRETVKDTLRVVIAKTDEERLRFEQCFESYFANAGFEPKDPDAPVIEPLDVADADLAAVRAAIANSPLAQILLADDRAALIRLLHQAAAAADIAAIRAFTQANLFVRRVLEQMGITSLDEAIARLRGSGVPAEARVAEFLDNRRRAVRELARDLIERRLALAADERSRARDEFLRDARLTNVDRRDLERMRLLVRAMARKLATRYGRTRKRARRGQLDVRHTVRRNVAFDGVPFRTTWKQKKISKPRVVVLCDVSGSVAALAQFLLLFVHSLNEALGDIRSFAFSSTTIEVTEMLEKAPTIDDAISQIMYAIGFRSSDYGRSFAEFDRRWPDIVDRKTTVIILGDGRTNYADPRIDIVRRLFERAKRVVWLNPENRIGWGLDDSEMLRYLPYTHSATVCNRLRHLEAVVNELLSQPH